MNPLIQSSTGASLVESSTAAPPANAVGVVVRPVAAPVSVDFFGRQRVSEPDVVFATSPQYSANSLAWQTMTSGDGNGAAWSAATRDVTLTLAAAGYVVRQSYRYLVYQLGRPVRVILTGNVGTNAAGVTKRWGQFDAANGIYWQVDNTTLSVGVRSSTSGSAVNTVVARADWNGDKLDGTGPSGFTLDLTRNNVYVLEYAWLGAAGVRWGVFVNGTIVYVHTQVFANTLSTSYMQSATLPLRWEISAAGAPAAPATLVEVCSQAESEGGYLTAPGRSFSAGRLVAGAISVNAAENVVMALRPSVTHGTVPNRVQIEIQDVNVIATANAALNWRLLYYPPGTADPVTGGTWAAANAESAVEINVAGTALSLTGAYEIAQGSLAASAQSRGQALSRVVSAFPLTLNACGAESPLTSVAGASPATLVLAASGSGASAAGGVRWWEMY